MCVHQIGCSSKAGSGNMVIFYVGGVLHSTNTAEIVIHIFQGVRGVVQGAGGTEILW